MTEYFCLDVLWW